VFNIFAAAALQSADGAFLLGQMAPFTSSPRQWVFPCGTLDPGDISSASRLDLVGSLGRELFEETGLDIDVCQVEPGWTLVRDGGFVALMKRIMVNASAEQLQTNIMHHLANEARPEFTAVRIVRRLTDLGPDTPRFYVHYLMGEWL
jgi:8-oxo-dGTP pyrophosphatase MutT (NUDIX family)